MFLSAGVPDSPRSIMVRSSLADAVELSIESPEEDGGVPVTGYQIRHGDVIEDFSDPGRSHNVEIDNNENFGFYLFCLFFTFI